MLIHYVEEYLPRLPLVRLKIESERENHGYHPLDKEDKHRLIVKLFESQKSYDGIEK